MRAHAILSASASKQWLNCTPSALINAKAEKQASEYAKEGTLAHNFCENELLRYFKECIRDEDYKANLELYRKDELYNEEMEDCATSYLNFVLEELKEHKGETLKLVEERVDFSNYVPDGFGTADCIIASDGLISVVDYKHGKGVEVSSVDNPQMKLYALGAINYLSIVQDVKDDDIVRLSIYQPRIYNTDNTWSVTVKELRDWANNEVVPKAKLAIQGKGNFKAGAHCKFCAIAGTCKERADYLASIYEDNKALLNKDYEITPERLSELLDATDSMTDWLNALKERALKLALDGVNVPNYKLVAKRVNRVLDTEKAFKCYVENGYDEALLYERKPLGITNLEKLIGKKKFNELSKDFITIPTAEPTLAHISDKRPVYSSAKADFDNATDSLLL